VCNKLKAVTHALASLLEDTTQCSSNGFSRFCDYIRLAVGDPYGRARGQGLLWESVERVQGVAKLVPLRERLAGMCGSVRVLKANLVNPLGGLGFAHHPCRGVLE
jgi:hypothetical protein